MIRLLPTLLLAGCAVIPWPVEKKAPQAPAAEPAAATPVYCAATEPTVCPREEPEVVRERCNCPKREACAGPAYVLTTLLDAEALRLLVDEYRNALEACHK